MQCCGARPTVVACACSFVLVRAWAYELAMGTRRQAMNFRYGSKESPEGGQQTVAGSSAAYPASPKGDPHFQTGSRPCRYGHTLGRYKSGACIACARERALRWRAENPEKVLEIQRRSDARPERQAKKAAGKRERRKNPAYRRKEAAYQRRRFWTDPEYRARKSAHDSARNKKWRQANPDRVKAQKAAWKQKYPERARIAERRKEAKRRRIPGSFRTSDIDRILKLQRGRCAYCRKRLDKYEIDHIVPIAAGGTNRARNLQLTCVGGCNQDKGARDPIEYARSLGLLL